MTANEVETWLRERMAEELGVEPGAIDRDESFAGLGLTSMNAVTLSGELETHMGQTLPPTLLWDEPSLAELMAFLVRERLVTA